MATQQAIEALRVAGVRSVRLQFSDLHGVVRGREIPIADFPGIAEDGTGFVEAVMTVDLRHNIVSGFAFGQCGFNVMSPDPNYPNGDGTGGPQPISVKAA